MPLLLTRHPFPNTTFGLWQIAEEDRFFRNEIPLSAEEEAEMARFVNNLRRREWLAARWLLHKLTGAPQRLPLAKDAFSKPFFPESQHMACSLSHSHGTVGALILDNAPPTIHHSPSQPSTPDPELSTSNFQPSTPPTTCGCDIQALVDKMPRLAGKFMNVEEERFVRDYPAPDRFDLLHVFWTAKESLYKAYGLKELDFRAHLRVEPFEWRDGRGEAIGRVEKNAVRQEYRLRFEKFGLPGEGGMVWTVCVP